MNKYHISKKTYFSKIFKSVGLTFFIFIAYMLIFFYTGDENAELRQQPFIIELGIFIVPLLAFIISLIYFWILIKKHTFYEKNNNFVIEKGIFYKSKSKIAFKNIVTIAIKRSLLDMILGISKIEIDTGTTAGLLPEGSLKLDKSYALLLKEYLENKKNDKDLILPNPHIKSEIADKEENVIYKASFGKLFILGILREGLLTTITSIIILVSSIIQIGVLTSTDVVTESSNAFLSSLISISVMIFGTTLMFGLFHGFIYYGYKLSIVDDTIEYEYGLFSKTNFKVKINKINALYLKQSLGFKLFKYYSLDASVIGIGDNISNNDNKQQRNESRYILPITKKAVLLEVLELLNAKELVNNDYIKPVKFRKLNFVYMPLMLVTIPLIILFIIFNALAIKVYIIFISIIFIYILIIIGLILRLKNHGFYINQNLNIKRGAFTVVRVLIKKQRIQTINYLQNPIDQLLNIGNIEFKYKRLLGKVTLKGYKREDFAYSNKKIF